MTSHICAASQTVRNVQTGFIRYSVAMAEGYNFVAPQFVESLGEADLDDGADNFFDAEEGAASNKASTENLPNLDSDKKAAEAPSSPKQSADEGVSDEVKAQDDIANPNCPDENKMPLAVKKIGRESRLSRMSVKKMTPPTRKSARFMSLAEQIHKFHHGTPPRFKRKSGVFKGTGSKILPTIAHSPLLQTKIRSRPSTAQPVAVSERPVLKPVVKRLQAKPPPKPAPKPPTVPQPFNLTDTNKFKKVQKTKSEESVSKTPKKPVNMKKKTLQIQGDKLVLKETWAITGLKTTDRPPTRTKPVPFSFEQRDQERLKAKQIKLDEAKDGKNEFKVPSSKPEHMCRPSSAANGKSPGKKLLPRASLQHK